MLDNRTFEETPELDLPTSSRIFKSRFIDEFKPADRDVRKKGRLIAQNYSDESVTEVSKKDPTISRASQMLLICLDAWVDDVKLYTRDVNQAYMQSTFDLARKVYIRAPRELGIVQNNVLKIVKALYCIPKAGLYWYLTYINLHQKELDMKYTHADRWLLYRTKKGKIDGEIALQVEETLGYGTTELLRVEQTASKKFNYTPRKVLENTNKFSVNGVNIHKGKEGKIIIDQSEKVKMSEEITANCKHHSASAVHSCEKDTRRCRTHTVDGPCK